MLYNFDELALQIMTVDHVVHKAGYFKVAGRPYAALSFRVKGSVSFEVAGERFLSRQGDMLFIPAGVDYSAEYTDGEIIVVHLIGCNYTQTEHFSLHNPRYLQMLFADMLEAWRTGHSVNRAKSAVFAVLERLEADQARNYGDAFSACLNHIQKNFTEPNLRLGELTQVSGISESGLDRRFQQYFGLSPKQYILKLRLSYAMELLARGDWAIRDVARLSGFRDEKYFSRIVKERFGRSPSSFLGKGPGA